MLVLISAITMCSTLTACDYLADGLTYEKLADGTYAVTGVVSYETTIKIPSKIKGASVTQIGVDAFRNKTYVEEVELPDTVKKICDSAFEGAYGLQKINLENVEVLGRNVFKNSFGKIPKVQLTLNKITSIGARCFENALGLNKITINGNVSVIPRYAFASCSGLATVILGSGVKRLENCAFTGCSSLANLSMPSVEYIGEECFNSCIVITSLNLPNIQEIKERAFNNCTFITDVTCGENLKQLFPLAFYGCAALATFTLTNPVASDWCYAMVNANTTMATITDADSCQGSKYKHLLNDPAGFAIRLKSGSFNRDSCFLTKTWAEENGLVVGQSYTFTVFK